VEYFSKGECLELFKDGVPWSESVRGLLRRGTVVLAYQVSILFCFDGMVTDLFCFFFSSFLISIAILPAIFSVNGGHVYRYQAIYSGHYKSHHQASETLAGGILEGVAELSQPLLSIRSHIRA
jgi:hypothetical protein